MNNERMSFVHTLIERKKSGKDWAEKEKEKGLNMKRRKGQ